MKEVEGNWWQVQVDDLESDVEVSATRLADLLTWMGVGQQVEHVDEDTWHMELPPFLYKVMIEGGSFQFAWNGLSVSAENHPAL